MFDSFRPLGERYKKRRQMSDVVTKPGQLSDIIGVFVCHGWIRSFVRSFVRSFGSLISRNLAKQDHVIHQSRTNANEKPFSSRDVDCYLYIQYIRTYVLTTNFSACLVIYRYLVIE